MSLSSMQPSNATKLPNLPCELLVQVVEQLDDESIIQLSMTCWKFHLLALPVVFTRANLLEDTTYLSLQQPPAHLLHALRIALFVNHAASFITSFTPDADRLLPEILSLNRLISRMSTMAMTTFIFPHSSLPLSPPDEDSVFNEERWTREVIRFFDMVLDKSCACLEVSGDMIPTRPTLTGPTNAPSLRAAFLLQCLSCEKIGHRLRNLPNTFKHTILSFVRHFGSPRHHRILRRFHALSPDLFQSHFLNWTTSTLLMSASTLTDVSFKTDHIPASTWHGLLPKLTLPSLVKFQVTCDRIIEQRTAEFNDMLNFLKRHPSIIDLDLYGLTSPTNCRRPRDLLPALKTLTSNPELIVWLLDYEHPSLCSTLFRCCRAREYPLKHLESLNIASEIYRQSPAFDYNAFDDVLTLLSRSAPSLTTLTMSFFSAPGVTEWIDKYVSGDHGSLSGSPTALKGVTTLKVVSPWSWEEVVVNRIPRFLAKFPELEHFIYPALPPDLDMEIVEGTFLTEIALTCPRMRKVTIGNVKVVDLGPLRGG